MMGIGFGMGFFGWIWMLLFWGALILVAIWLVALLFPSAKKEGEVDQSLSASEILRLRFARGELSQEQYQEMLQTLQES